MSEYNAPATLTTPGGVVLFNRPGDLGFHHVDMCSGLNRQPNNTRPVYENKPRTHGVNTYPTLYGGRQIVLGGWCRATTVAARSAWFDALGTALDSIMDGQLGTYAWDTTIGTKVITVQCEMPDTPVGRWLKKYQFGLISETLLV